MPLMKQYFLVAPLAMTGSRQTGLTYSFDSALKPGSLVDIPLGRRQLQGVVLSAVDKPDFPVKDISRLRAAGLVPTHLIQLAEWISHYYLTDLGRVWQTMLPAGITRKRRVAAGQADKFKLIKMSSALTSLQRSALDEIQAKHPSNHLLYGVTGAGKTQVYLETAQWMMSQNRSSIILVPEIALTPQVIAQFETLFGDRVVANHSGLTESQRHQAWQKAQQSNDALVAIGPRSTLFIPVPRPGLIVVDESHETSYKQDQSPRYHAAPVAAKLASLTGSTLILGSATPAVTDIFLAEQRRLNLLRLDERIGGAQPPHIEIVNLRDKLNTAQSQLISTPLMAALEETFRHRRQSLLFLNRRGSASALLCNNCGWVSTCPNCQLPLTFHADQIKLVCHHCNHRQQPPAACPECSAAALRYLGHGTKRLETEVARFFPEMRVARLDRDSAGHTDLHQLYTQLHQGDIDLILGTQMIAKGLDLPLLDTVGIINADSSLYLPDYTASERCYQLISQVAGRSGRRGQSSKVFVQTYSPDHPAIAAATDHDYWGFAQAELQSRRLLGYPPYRYLLKLTHAAKTASQAESKGMELSHKLAADSQLDVMGPAPAFRELNAGKYHWQLIVKARSRQKLLDAAAAAGSGWIIDLDPQNLL